MKPRTIAVASPHGRYDVVIGPGVLDSLGQTARSVSAARMAVLVADDTTGELFGQRAAGSLEKAGFRVERLTVPPGETSKSWRRAGDVLESFSERGLARDDLVVALGGGVVGDLAGFCAATYMRGVGLIQVPTTLLAQVDSSIGGKTGVDLPRGKNLAGAFWQPLAVIADTACLVSLSDEDWRSGLAEVAKSAILDGEEAVRTLEAEAARLVRREPAVVESAVIMAASLKARVVSADEREAHDREALNYGHTLGHAIERVAGYGAVAHGVAVADGIRFAARLAELVGGSDPAWTRRQSDLLDVLGLRRGECPYDAQALVASMYADKKVRGGEVRFVLSDGPGRWRVQAIDEATLLTELRGVCGTGH
jgi:3-dehydroquinate synthase